MLRLIFLFILFPLISTRIIIENDQPKMSTKYGDIYGLQRQLPSRKSVFTFEGVPYAKPPINSLRFEKPQPLEAFGTINATKQRLKCMQFYGKSSPGIVDSEDCLYLNIATPNHASTVGRKYPVMVFIHGGAFISGDGNHAFCTDFFERFVTHHIIYITINYRLGPLGFYSTGDSEAPGNYGLWDQIQALKFIHEILDDLNGDKSRVTIFGPSAGGASVSYLSHSPHIAGLASQGVAYSGTSHSLWARTHDIQANHMEETLGCGESDKKKECLKTKSIEEIMEVEKLNWYLMKDRLDGGWWSPRLDNHLIHGTDLSDALNYAPKIKMLYGMNSLEEAGFAVYRRPYPLNSTYYPITQKKAESFDEKDLEAGLRYLLSRDTLFRDHSVAVQKIIDFYKDESEKFTSGNKFLQSYVQFFHDVHFGLAAIHEVRAKASSNNTVYFYLHDYRIPNFPFHNPLLPVGTSHCEESIYLFGNYTGTEPPVRGIYRKNMKKFVKMWISFVKYGVPIHSGYSLQPVTPNTVPYLHIQEKTTFRSNLWSDRYNFWRRITRDYGFDWIAGYHNEFL